MGTNRPVSVSSISSDNMPDGQRDTWNVCTVSPDPVSPMSSESASSVNHFEEASIKPSQPRTRWLTTFVPPIFKRPRPLWTRTTFKRCMRIERQPIPKLLLFAIIVSVAFIVLATLFIYYMIHFRSLTPPNNIQKTIASWGLSDYPTQPAAKLPLDFSHGIVPIPCNSHNDYWRHVPLYDALAAGCISVEVDVWLSGNHLLLGYPQNSSSPEQTLKSLYIDPLVSIFSNQSTPTQITTTNGTSSSDLTKNPRGVFETSPTTPLVLLINIRTNGTNGRSTFLALHDHIEPFRKPGWLTYFNGAVVVPGLITVVSSGTTPFDLVVANSTYRDIFYDAPLEELWPDSTMSTNYTFSNSYSPRNSYYASASFQKQIGNLCHGVLSPQQVLTIQRQVKAANDRGLKARYWDAPTWPVDSRNYVWDVLLKARVGIVGVDEDLEAAKEWNWGG